jgi:hypothetical protein
MRARYRSWDGRGRTGGHGRRVFTPAILCCLVLRKMA